MRREKMLMLAGMPERSATTLSILKVTPSVFCFSILNFKVMDWVMGMGWNVT